MNKNEYLAQDYLDVSHAIDNLSLKNKTFLITGATGTLASFMINSLLINNKFSGSKNRIIVISRNLKQSKELFKNSKSIIFKTYDSKIYEKIDFIFHFACPTDSKFFVEHPLKTLRSITSLTEKYLNYANKNKCRFIYISSMEVYGKIKDRKPKSEEELGSLSLESPRSSYPLGKRVAESLCHYYYTENNTNIVIARLAQTFGPGSKKTDNRLYSYAAKCVLNNKDIVLSTDGNSYGNYVYLSDAIRALFYIAVKGKINSIYNVVNTQTNIKIKEMCKLLCKSKNKIILNKGRNFYPDNTQLKMSNNALTKLGWKPKYDLKEMLERYLEYLKLDR